MRGADPRQGSRAGGSSSRPSRPSSWSSTAPRSGARSRGRSWSTSRTPAAISSASPEWGRTTFSLSGRWFQAISLDGPWRFVPQSELSEEFARIPDDSPKENVKASVAGTAQASEALIANSIPETAEIKRARRRSSLRGSTGSRSGSRSILHVRSPRRSPTSRTRRRRFCACARTPTTPSIAASGSSRRTSPGRGSSRSTSRTRSMPSRRRARCTT